MGFSLLWGGGGVSFHFLFLKMNRLGFCWCVCIFYSALSYKSPLSHSIPSVFAGLACERACFPCACLYFSVLNCFFSPEFAFSWWISCLLFLKCFEGLEFTYKHPLNSYSCMFSITYILSYLLDFPPRICFRDWSQALRVRIRLSIPVNNTL